MRLGWFLLISLVGLSFPSAQAQLSLGPNGLSTPPINLVSVFKFLRDIWVAYMYPVPSETEVISKEGNLDLIPVIEGNEADSAQLRVVSVIGYDSQGNIVEKFDSGCLDDADGTGECFNNHGDEETFTEDPPEYRLGSDSSSTQGVVEDKTGTTGQVVVGKWPILYISLISILFWLFVIVATPYVLTGETLARREDDFSPNSIVDQQDVLLLLSWLLGEVSEDPSCLERVVCLTPTKSSRYIYVSSMIFNVASYFQRWGVPYSPRFEDILLGLEDVALDGFSQSCQDYSCPTIPEL